MNVAVIEAGDFYENVNGNRSRVPGYGAQVAVPGVDWGLKSTPQPDLGGREAPYGQGKYVGGSSAVNLITYHRSTKGGQDRWASAVGDNGFQFSNFLPWMRKAVKFTPPNVSVRAQNATVPAPSAESFDQNGGPVGITFPNWANPVSSYAAEGWKSLGLNQISDLTSGSLIGNQYSPMAITASDQSRSTSALFLEYGINSGRTNLFIFTKSLAKKITFDNTKKATSVIATSSGTTFELKAKKEIVVTAGTFHTPQLLMVSGVGPQETLQKLNIPVVKAAPGVGKNLQDHPNFVVAFNASVVTSSSLLDPAAADAAAKEYNEKHTGILTHNMADYYAWEKIPTNQLSAGAKSDLSKLPADWPHYEIIVADVPFGPGQSAQGICQMQAVTSRGTVSISSANTDDMPVLDVKTLSTATDREVAIKAVKRIREFYNTPSLKKVIGAEIFPGSSVASDDQILEFLKANINAGAHACCTAAMGKTSDPNAVVDTRGRVIGVKGLRVADASAMPLVTPGHLVGSLCKYSFTPLTDERGHANEVCRWTR